MFEDPNDDSGTQFGEDVDNIYGTEDDVNENEVDEEDEEPAQRKHQEACSG